jgi:4a-hydroxytetrahydrobiopterin dehydratase
MTVKDPNCLYCEDAIRSLTGAEEEESLLRIPGWELHRENDHKISRKYSFGSYMDLIDFVNKIAAEAETAGHHPDMHLFYKTLHVELSTHAVHGLSAKDFSLAARINALYGR